MGPELTRRGFLTAVGGLTGNLLIPTVSALAEATGPTEVLQLYVLGGQTALARDTLATIDIGTSVEKRLGALCFVGPWGIEFRYMGSDSVWINALELSVPQAVWKFIAKTRGEISMGPPRKVLNGVLIQIKFLESLANISGV